MKPSTLNVVGSIPPVSDRDPVREFLIGRMVRDGAHNWMDEFRKQSRKKNVNFYPTILRKQPDEAMGVMPEESEIDLMVCFVSKVHPGMVEQIGKVITEARLRKLLILSHGSLDWGSDWLHNFGTLPTSAKKNGHILDTSEARMMPRNRVQIHEIGYYREKSMRALVQELLSEKAA